MPVTGDSVAEFIAYMCSRKYGWLVGRSLFDIQPTPLEPYQDKRNMAQVRSLQLSQQ